MEIANNVSSASHHEVLCVMSLAFSFDDVRPEAIDEDCDGRRVVSRSSVYFQLEERILLLLSLGTTAIVDAMAGQTAITTASVSGSQPGKAIFYTLH